MPRLAASRNRWTGYAVARLAAAYAAAVPVVAHAQTMPGCGDPPILERIGVLYRVLESNTAHTKIAGFGAIRETGLGPPPRSANQYANDRVYIAETRYCEAQVMLEGGGGDTAYWTIHHFKTDGADEFRPDVCSATHDSWGDGCAQWRPGK